MEFLNVKEPEPIARVNVPEAFRLTLAKGIAALEWSEFEKLAAALFEGLGYEVRLTPVTDDQGIDLLLTDKESGALDVAQCKHWKEQIGSPVVRDFYGALVHFEARRGFILATGGVSQSAREFAKGKPILFYGADELVDEMLASIGCSVIQTVERPQVLGLKRKVYRAIVEQVEAKARAKVREDIRSKLTTYALNADLRRAMENLLDKL